MSMNKQGGHRPSHDHSGKTRPELLRAMLRSFAIIALTLLTLALLAAGPESQQATLVVKTGQASIMSRMTIVPGIGIPNTIVLQSGEAQTVRQGDTIRMDAASTGELSLSDGTRVELAEGAILTISQLRDIQNTSRVILRLDAGHIYNRVIRLLNSGDSFDIETPSSTASVRGTAFQITVLDAEASFYATDEGLVGIALEDQKVELPAGHQVLARVGEPLHVVQQGPPVLILTSPTDSPEQGSLVEVSGQTLPGTRITVAGTPVSVSDNGTFSTRVQATESAIQVEATDLSGLTLTVEITTH